MAEDRGLSIKKMLGKQLTTAMTVLIFSLCSPPAMGKRLDAKATDTGFSENPTFAAVMQESIILAQNDNRTPEDKEKTTSDPETKGSETASEPAADNEEKSSNAESKPLKPFVPSEIIPGEQAVDFPADI